MGISLSLILLMLLLSLVECMLEEQASGTSNNRDYGMYRELGRGALSLTNEIGKTPKLRYLYTSQSVFNSTDRMAQNSSYMT